MRKYSPLLALVSLIVVAVLVVFALRAAKTDAIKQSQEEAIIAQNRLDERKLADDEQTIGSTEEWNAAMQRRTDHLKKMQDELRAARDRGADPVELAQRQLNVSLNELALKRLETMAR